MNAIIKKSPKYLQIFKQFDKVEGKVIKIYPSFYLLKFGECLGLLRLPNIIDGVEIKMNDLIDVFILDFKYYKNNPETNLFFLSMKNENLSIEKEYWEQYKENPFKFWKTNELKPVLFGEYLYIENLRCHHVIDVSDLSKNDLENIKLNIIEKNIDMFYLKRIDEEFKFIEYGIVDKV